MYNMLYMFFLNSSLRYCCKQLLLLNVFADSLSRSFWREAENLSSKPPPGASQIPVTVHRTPPLTSATDGAVEQSEAEVGYSPSQCNQDHRSASNRTNPQEHPAPT